MIKIEGIFTLGKDAEIKQIGDKPYIVFTGASNESYMKDGQKVTNTTWVSFLKYGESKVLDYLKKGTQVFVRGSLSVKPYGEGKIDISCRVDELELLGSKQESGTQQPPKAEKAVESPYASGMPEQSDDIPF